MRSALRSAAFALADRPRADDFPSMKISVVGLGRVGSTLAFALSQRNFVHEMILVDRHREAAIGDALDLRHAQSFVEVPTRINAGTVEDTRVSDIIAICASVPTPADMANR